jgi:proteasome accessory factor A
LQLPASGDAQDSESDSQDFGRKFLFNGGCVYIDLNHLELCSPEVRSAWDHLAYTHALYRIAWAAAEGANQRQPAGHKIYVMANNSDGQDNSYGSHLNFLVHRDALENILYRRLLVQGYLAAYQVSSIIFTGQGKVGSENGTPAVDYQLSQRADFFEMLCGLQTTYRRPIINSRDEPLCGSWKAKIDDPSADDLTRLHVIFYDHNLCHVAGLLKVGVMQIILAMIEAGLARADLLLEDPVGTVVQWSHDPLLQSRAQLFSGDETTALELQLRFFEEAGKFVASGACDEAVPGAREILRLWGDTLDRLKAGDLAALAPRLDWVRKLTILNQALRQRPDLSWSSPGVKHLDQLYASLDPVHGLFNAYEKRGLVDRLVSEEQILRCMHEPPADTRAWTRSALLLKAEPDEIDEVDWDFVRFKLAGKTRWDARRIFTVNLCSPLEWTSEQVKPRLAGAHSLMDTLTALSAVESQPAAVATGWGKADGDYRSYSNLPAPSAPMPYCPTNGDKNPQ